VSVEHGMPGPRSSANPTAVLIAGAVIFLATVAAYLFCEVNHLNSGPMLYLAGPVIAALLIANRVDSLGNRTNRQLEHVAGEVQTVKQQTNGELTARINASHDSLAQRMPAIVDDAVRRILAERDQVATAAVTAGVVPAPAPAVVPPPAPGPLEGGDSI
jgi:hypothetical protein